jgi:hypothetical protein
MKTTTTILVLCVAALGCDGDETLSACVEGWWQDAAAGTCACPGAPECDATDCEGLRVLGFTADGRAFTGIVRASAERQTASAIGSLSNGTYTVEDSVIRVTPADAPAYSGETECDAGAGTVVFNGVVKVRAPDWLAAQLTTIAQP